MVLGIFLLYYSLSGVYYSEFVYSLSILFFLLTGWILFSLRYIQFDLFNFYSLFLLAAILFNGGQILLEAFRLNRDGMLGDLFSANQLVETISFITLALFCFHVGGLVSGSMHGGRDNHTQIRKEYPETVTLKSLRITGYFLIIISIVPAYAELFGAMKIVLEGGYFALFQQEIVTGLGSGILGVMKILSPLYLAGLLYVMVGSKKKQVLRNIVLSVILIHILILLFLGQRSYGSMMIFAAAWVWHKTVKPIPIHKTVITGCIMLFVLFPTIKLIRNIEGGARLTLPFMVESYFSIDNPAIAIIDEMGTSMNTTAYTMQLVPGVQDYLYGSSYLYGMTTFIPNIFWDIHPGILHGSLSRWLTLTVDPAKFYSGAGFGYSFIAESYANFGWYATPFFMMVTGFVIAYISRRLSHDGYPERIVIMAICFSIVIFWVRQDITIFSRHLFYTILFPYLLFRLIRREIAVSYRRRTYG